MITELRRAYKAQGIPWIHKIEPIDPQPLVDAYGTDDWKEMRNHYWTRLIPIALMRFSTTPDEVLDEMLFSIGCPPSRGRGLSALENYILNHHPQASPFGLINKVMQFIQSVGRDYHHALLNPCTRYQKRKRPSPKFERLTFDPIIPEYNHEVFELLRTYPLKTRYCLLRSLSLKHREANKILDAKISSGVGCRWLMTFDDQILIDFLAEVRQWQAQPICF